VTRCTKQVERICSNYRKKKRYPRKGVEGQEGKKEKFILPGRKMGEMKKGGMDMLCGQRGQFMYEREKGKRISDRGLSR